MVLRVYVERKPPFRLEAQALKRDAISFLGISKLRDVRIANRYDVEGLERDLFETVKTTILSEPQIDEASLRFETPGAQVFAVEYLPGQFDQRADSAAQCIQLLAGCERPLVRCAKVYALYGDLSQSDVEAIEQYVVNPVDSRLAAMELPSTLKEEHELPENVRVLDGFRELSGEALTEFVSSYALAMDEADVAFCQAYFRQVGRDPTITELRVIDTYWSDHCRHTTFLTHLRNVEIEDPIVRTAWERYLKIREELGTHKPVTLMDLGTIGAKYLKKIGMLTDLDESEEINACTVRIDVDVDAQIQKWLLLFKNETHNHPTEIEPFGGAATCIGGAIRDPLSGRGYVYQAMRITGAANPLQPVEETMPGKLPQKKLTVTAANGYSSYGNQIGLATGLVDELYHPGYAAKRMEIGAVIAAAPAANVRREQPAPGDVVILLGGRTGRDGCGGATGSSKSHNLQSLTKCGAEVQKGNAPEERKLQRLFRDGSTARMIKRCNDFGAGGVSVAIGELADGLLIDLNAVKRKYDGLDGTELAISESQERMAVVLDPQDEEEFIRRAHAENLEATKVAVVTREKRMIMRWNDREIVNLTREFLSSNGASRCADATIPGLSATQSGTREKKDFSHRLTDLMGGLDACSRRGLSERFDSTIGAGTIFMPFGGRRQRTPLQAMVARIPVLEGETETCSAMSYGGGPALMDNPFRGAYLAVLESLCRLAATGIDRRSAHLTFQEYFERMNQDPNRWGQPVAALLGALCAQLDLEVAAIGGKDSMSGSFENLDVPPTLISFAVGIGKSRQVVSPEFKRAGSRVYRLDPMVGDNGLPDPKSMKALLDRVSALCRSGRILSCQALGIHGASEMIVKSSMGNALGFEGAAGLEADSLFEPAIGSFLLETEQALEDATFYGHVVAERWLSIGDRTADLDAVEKAYEEKLEPVFPSRTDTAQHALEAFRCDVGRAQSRALPCAHPRVLIPVFPGTNCEYDTARAFEAAGARAEILVINNLTAQGIADSAKRMAKALSNAQILFLPGGFSGGDEPDGSGKFITAFLRNPAIHEQVDELLERDGLIGGICNGFQALIKLGLVPFGRIQPMTAQAPTLTYNTIARHQSRLVRTRVASKLSPWLSMCELDDIHLLPISHGEGRFVIGEDLMKQLVSSGQIATQYVDEKGNPSMDIDVNPNGSMYAVEGITSADGRVFGRMAHAERRGKNLYRNVEGNTFCPMFESAVAWFA